MEEVLLHFCNRCRVTERLFVTWQELKRLLLHQMTPCLLVHAHKAVTRFTPELAHAFSVMLLVPFLVEFLPK